MSLISCCIFCSGGWIRARGGGEGHLRRLKGWGGGGGEWFKTKSDKGGSKMSKKF